MSTSDGVLEFVGVSRHIVFFATSYPMKKGFGFGFMSFNVAVQNISPPLSI